MRATYPRAPLPRWRVSRRTVIAALAAAGAAAAVGCSSDSSSKAPPTGAGATTGAGSPGAAAASATAAPKDFLSSIPENPPDPFTDKDIQTGGTLTRLWNRQASLDYFTTSSISSVAEVTAQVYSRLIRLACRANMKSVMTPELEPDLATAWEQPDKTTLIFTLAPNIKYHNLKPLGGRAFTVDDIAYSINRGKTFQRSAYKTYYNHIQKVEDVSGGKVKLTLDGPYPAIQQLLGVPFMQIMPPEIGDNPDLAQVTAVGTGGMMMVKNTPNVEFVYQKHPDFFKTDSTGRKKPYIDGYTLSVVSDEATRLALFESGKADFIYGVDSPVTLDNLEDFAKRNPKVVIQLRPTALTGIHAIAGHFQEAPWSDARVRRAVALAADRDTMIQTIFHGRAINGPFFTWPYLFDRPRTNQELGPNYTYDPKQAKQLLAAAGFPNGLDLDLTWYEAANYDQVLTLFKQTAADAGLRLNLIKSPDVASHNQKLSAKNWNGLIMAARGVPFIDPSATMPYFLPGNALNYGEVNDPALVALNTRMESALGDERKTIARQIFDQLVTQAYEVTLPNGNTLDAWSPRLKNWVNTTWTANSGYGMGSMDQVWIG